MTAGRCPPRFACTWAACGMPLTSCPAGPVWAGRIPFYDPLEAFPMLRSERCADSGACDCFDCRPSPLTAAHVAAVLKRSGAELDFMDRDVLEQMTAEQLADQLAYIADFQG
jgi:hypothetical protein